MKRQLIHSTYIEGLQELLGGQNIEIRPKLSCSSLGVRNIPRELVCLIEVKENDILAEFSGDAATDENGTPLQVKNYGWDEILVRGGAYRVVGFYADENSRIEEDAYLLIFSAFLYSDHQVPFYGKVAEKLYDKAYQMYLSDSEELDAIAEKYGFAEGGELPFDNFLNWFRKEILPYF